MARPLIAALAPAHLSGLKPAGVARSADGDAIVIVCDAGDAPPQWMEAPWPAR